MTKQLSLLVTTTIASALLLSGCGKAPVNMAAAQVLAARATAQSTAVTLGGHLVIDSFTDEFDGPANSRRNETYCVSGTCDGASFSFSATTFVPFYVPMLGDATLNGKAVTLTPALAAEVSKLVKSAAVTADEKSRMSNFLEGLDFIGRRATPAASN